MADTIRQIEVNGVPLKLVVDAEVFEPNLTTQMLAEAADIREGSVVADLGCGVGPLAIYAAKMGASHVYAVDIMEKACELARKNAELNGVADRVHVAQGSLFEPFDGQKFDIILDDVSGMSEEVSRISPWYPQTIPTGGYDGTEPTLAMLEQAKSHMNRNCTLLFPVLSLSDSAKILDRARSLFGSSLEAISEKMVPFCAEFKKHLPDMELLKDRKVIDYSQKRSRYLWRLEIYRAHRV
jgi:SAM-dependent methyltransferase